MGEVPVGRRLPGDVRRRRDRTESHCCCQIVDRGQNRMASEWDAELEHDINVASVRRSAHHRPA